MVVIINKVAILMMLGKLTNLGLLKIKTFLNKNYTATISTHDVISQVLSRDLSYTIDVAMWEKFGNSSISLKEVVKNLNFVRIWAEKPYSEGDLAWTSLIWGWH